MVAVPLPAGPSFQLPYMCRLRATRQRKAVSRHFLLLCPAPAPGSPLRIFYLLLSGHRASLTVSQPSLGNCLCLKHTGARAPGCLPTLGHGLLKAQSSWGKGRDFLSQSWAADRQQGRAGTGSVPMVTGL